MNGTGIDSLLTSLQALGADNRLTLPGVDDPLPASAYMQRCLALMREREIPFPMAWSSTINRIQAPQGEGGFAEDPDVAELVREERALLEECRPRWHAAYEGREPTAAELARSTVRAWDRTGAVPARSVAARGTARAAAKRAA